MMTRSGSCQAADEVIWHRRRNLCIGREFLGSERLEKTSCLILDVHMPGMDGLQLQQRLVASNHAIPIIFITAFTDDRARVQALKAGAIGYLAKPFADDELLDCIHAALKPPEGAALQPRRQ